jgi:hypothetical protein
MTATDPRKDRDATPAGVGVAIAEPLRALDTRMVCDRRETLLVAVKRGCGIG